MFRRASDSEGFTLIEVVVAFTILAFVIAATTNIFSTGFANIGVSDRYATAALLAQSRLAGIGVESPLTEGVSTGSFGEGFEWRNVVRAVRGIDDEATRRRRVIPYDVEVTVFWRDGSESRSVSLATVRLGAIQ